MVQPAPTDMNYGIKSKDYRLKPVDWRRPPNFPPSTRITYEYMQARIIRYVQTTYFLYLVRRSSTKEQS